MDDTNLNNISSNNACNCSHEDKYPPSPLFLHKYLNDFFLTGDYYPGENNEENYKNELKECIDYYIKENKYVDNYFCKLTYN